MKSGRMPWVVGLAMLAAAVAALLPWHYAMDCDEGAYVTAGWMVSEGARVYGDVVENKPPLLLWATALSVKASGGVELLRLLGALMAALAAWSAWVVGERYFGRKVGVLAAVFVALDPYFLAFWSRPLMHLVWVAGLALLSLALIEMANRPGRWWGYAGAGMAFGAALLMKQVAIAILPALFLAALWEGGGISRHRRAALFALGTLAALLPALAVLWQQGALADFWLYCFRMHEASGLSQFWQRARTLKGFWLGQTLLLIPVSALVGLLWKGPEPGAPSLKRGLAVLGTWFLLSHALLILPQQLGGHYLLPVLAPMVVLAAWLGVRIAARWRLWPVALVCIVALAGSWRFLRWERELLSAGRTEGTTLAQELAVGQAIAERTCPEDAILVLANPAFYFDAKRRPPGRYFSAFGAYEAAATRDEFRRALAEYVRSPGTRLVAVGKKYCRQPGFAADSVNAVLPIIREEYRLAATLPYPYDGDVELWVRPDATAGAR